MHSVEPRSDDQKDPVRLAVKALSAFGTDLDKNDVVVLLPLWAGLSSLTPSQIGEVVEAFPGDRDRCRHCGDRLARMWAHTPSGSEFCQPAGLGTTAGPRWQDSV